MTKILIMETKYYIEGLILKHIKNIAIKQMLINCNIE